MNRERAAQLLPIITVFAEGKVVQFFNNSRIWEDLPYPYFTDHSDYRIKPLEFPPLPEGLEWQNPGGLTLDQVGEGWRLLLKSEITEDSPIGIHRNDVHRWELGVWNTNGFIGHAGICVDETYRIPSSTPFPEPPKKPVMIPLTFTDLPTLFWIRDNLEQWLCSGRDPARGMVFAGSWKSLKDCQEEGLEFTETPNLSESWKPMWKEAP